MFIEEIEENFKSKNIYIQDLLDKDIHIYNKLEGYLSELKINMPLDNLLRALKNQYLYKNICEEILNLKL